MTASGRDPSRRTACARLVSGLGLWVGALPMAQGQSAYPGKVLPPSHSLPSELNQARAAHQPLIVMVSLAGCPFCKLVRENYLVPLVKQERMPVVQVDMRSNVVTRSFVGDAVTHDRLTRQWRIALAPTVLFFGEAGREIAERLQGASPDFYGAYLDQRLAQARASA